MGGMMETSSRAVLGVDQSIRATGLCILQDGRPALQEVVHTDDLRGLAALERAVDRITAIVQQFNPSIIAMEDYAYGARSSSIVPLVELGGCIKLSLHRLGYVTGREARFTAERLLVIQNQSTMKKFMLGNGSISKDTGYLLRVMERVKMRFDDDNIADAYMHAYMADMVTEILRGRVPFDRLTAVQQEALLSAGVKKRKGLSLARALKLTDAEKLELVGY